LPTLKNPKMDPVSESDPLPTFFDAATSGGELLVTFSIMAIVFGLLLVGGFLLLNGPQGRARASRSSRLREEERERNHRDLIQRIRSYSRHREAAIHEGAESPEAALRALQHYGEGVIDTIACNTRNVKQIDHIRAQVAQEVARLQASTGHLVGR